MNRKHIMRAATFALHASRLYIGLLIVLTVGCSPACSEEPLPQAPGRTAASQSKSDSIANHTERVTVQTSHASAESIQSLPVGSQVTFARNGYASSIHDNQILTVTERAGTSFSGLIQETGSIFERSGLGRRVADHVSGELQDGTLRFRVERYDLLTNTWKASWVATGAWGKTAELRWGGKEGSIKQALFVRERSILYSQDLQAFRAKQAAAVERGREHFIELQKKIDQLQRQGHNLVVIGVCESGQVDLSWTDYDSGTFRDGKYVEGRGRYVKDYRILAELSQLEHVNYLSFDSMPHEDDMLHLRSLRSIGFVGLSDKLLGTRIDALAGIDNLTFLSVRNISPSTVEKIARIKNLRGLRIWLNERSRQKEFVPEMLEQLQSLEKLERFFLTNHDSPAPETCWHLRKCKNLKILDVKVNNLSDRSVDALNTMPNLEEVHLFELTPDQLLKIRNDSIESLSVKIANGLSDELLKSWDLPDKLSTLELPYWTPEPKAEYVRRLKTMPAREHGLYQIVRVLMRVWDDYNTNDLTHQKEMILLLSGGLATDVVDVERPAIFKLALDALERLERSHAAYRAFMLSTASDAQTELETMFAHGMISERNAKAVQIQLYRFNEKVAVPLEPLFNTYDRNLLKLVRQQFLER